MYILQATRTYTSCSTRRTKDQRVLRTTLLSLANLPSHGPPGQNFHASNWSFNIPWLGGWMCHVGVVGLDKDRQWKVKGVCACVWSNHLPLSCPNIKEYTLLKPNTLRKYQLIELTLQENAMLTLYGHTHWQKHKKLEVYKFSQQRLNHTTTHNHNTRKCSIEITTRYITLHSQPCGG